MIMNKYNYFPIIDIMLSRHGRLFGIKFFATAHAKIMEKIGWKIKDVRCISSYPPKRLSCIDKHWSEMSTWEKVQAGPFLCKINPDCYDKRWMKHLEYFTIFKNEEEYFEQKNYVIATGRWAEFVRQ